MKEQKYEAIRLDDGSYHPVKFCATDAYEPSSPPLHDTGKRTTLPSGAVREPKTNKGRYDLISPIALRRLALIYEKGGKKYEDRNWEQGVNLSTFVDSAMRHLNQWREGLNDEDHLGHAAWNICALIHTEEMCQRGRLSAKLNDIPSYAPADSNGKWRL